MMNLTDRIPVVLVLIGIFLIFKAAKNVTCDQIQHAVYDAIISCTLGLVFITVRMADKTPQIIPFYPGAFIFMIAGLMIYLYVCKKHMKMEH